MEKQLQEHIESLLRLYDEARTTDEQETELAAFFRTTKDVPEEWMGYADLFSVFDTSESLFSENELDDCLMQPISQQDEKLKTNRVWLYSAIGAVAASVLLLLILDVRGLFQESPCSIDQTSVSNSSNERARLTKRVHPMHQTSAPDSSNECTRLTKRVHPIHQTSAPDSSKAHGGPEKPVEEMVASAEKNEVAVAETADVIIAETVNDIPTDRQALADIYLAETALQVAYERLAQMDELKAYAISLEAEEPQSSQLIVAF